MARSARRHLLPVLVAALLGAVALPAGAGASSTGAVVSNGTVALGVNQTGDLNYDCLPVLDLNCPSLGARVGIDYVARNLDGIAPGCPCEGWGMADAGSGLSGYANESTGTANVSVNSFTASPDGRQAISSVSISDPAISGRSMRVVQDYHPSSLSSNLYEDTVTVTNTGSATLTDLRYRRVMDWDISPTAFSEYVTLHGTSPQLRFDSDDGFATADPLAGPSYIFSQDTCGDGYTGTCQLNDSGPADHGSLFDFGFGALAPGATKSFKVYYGAAGTETGALSALSAAGAQVYSLGESSCPNSLGIVGCSDLPAGAGKDLGQPATFIFGFVTTTGDVSVTNSDAPDPVVRGGRLTYSLRVHNTGPDNAAAVQLTDALPVGTSLVSATPSQGTCTGTSTVTCSLGTIGSGADATVSLVVTPGAGGSLSDTATVTTASDDANPANNSATATTTVTVPDTTPPAVGLTDPGAGATVTDFRPTYDGAAGTAAGDAGTVTVTLHDGASATGTLRQTLTASAGGPLWSVTGTTPLPNGTYTAVAAQTDAAGNTGTSAAHTFTVSAPAPDTVIASGPGGPTNSATPAFAFAAAAPQAGQSFRCRIDAAAFTACTSPYTAPALGEGGHTFAVEAIDAAGNVDPSPATRGFTVDTTAPTSFFTGGPTGLTADPTPAFTFDTTEGGVAFSCRIDSGAWTACTSPYPAPALADGGHSISVRATDPAGNVEAVPPVRSFTVDTTAPDTAIDAAPSGTTTDRTPVIAFHGTGGATSFACRVDAGAWTPCASPWTTSTLADGSHTVSVRASDAAGNTDATPDSATFMVQAADTTPPETTLTGGPSGTVADPTPSFSFTSSEAGSTFECQVDAGAWIACASPARAAMLADGDHTFAVRATDAAGNTDATPATSGFTVDTTAPATTIDSGPSGTVTDHTPAFAFHASEAGSTFACRIDAGAWAACSSPATMAPLADGDHTFAVRATDAAGNTEATPATRDFTVQTPAPPDTTPPETTITDGPTGVIADPRPSFAFSSSEAGSTFACRLDAGGWTDCTSPYTPAADLGDGGHTFAVRATDAAGNTDASPATSAFDVKRVVTPPPPPPPPPGDTTPPDTVLDSGPLGVTALLAPIFGFHATEAGSSFQCALDAGAWGACASPFTVAGLRAGDHLLRIRARDAAGNVDPSPVLRPFSLLFGVGSVLAPAVSVAPARTFGTVAARAYFPAAGRVTFVLSAIYRIAPRHGAAARTHTLRLATATRRVSPAHALALTLRPRSRATAAALRRARGAKLVLKTAFVPAHGRPRTVIKRIPAARAARD